MKPIVYFFGFVLVLSLTGMAYAEYNPWEIQPVLPMGIGGTVFIDGEHAPVGTVIAAAGENVGVGFIDNPLTLDRNPFGGFCQFKLMIQGTPTKWIDVSAPSGQYAVPEGSPVTITVNGQPAKVRFEDTETWLDTIPFRSGGVYFADIAIGSLPGIPKVLDMTVDTYSATWDKSEQKVINSMLTNRFSRAKNLGVILDGLKNNWWNPNYDVNWDAVNAAQPYVKKRILRQIEYAKQGKYIETGPDLYAMMDAQNWQDIKWYGYSYPRVGWTRWSLDEYARYNPPSLYIPPSDKGLIDSISMI
jgi:hypothetical protein